MKHTAIFLATMAAALAAFPLLLAADDVPTQIRVQVLIFGVDEKVGHFLTSERKNDTELFDELMSRYREDEAEIVTSTSIVARSGQRAKVEAVQEFIFVKSIETRDEGGVHSIGFETRNVGTILEVDPVLGPDNETIDINLVPEHHLAAPVMRQLLVGMEGKDKDSEITMPQFFVEKVTTATTLKDGGARLLGTVDPVAILKGSEGEEAAKGQLHLIFLKVDLVK